MARKVGTSNKDIEIEELPYTMDASGKVRFDVPGSRENYASILIANQATLSQALRQLQNLPVGLWTEVRVHGGSGRGEDVGNLL